MLAYFVTVATPACVGAARSVHTGVYRLPTAILYGNSYSIPRLSVACSPGGLQFSKLIVRSTLKSAARRRLESQRASVTGRTALALSPRGSCKKS